jgi:hypothetical protein
MHVATGVYMLPRPAPLHYFCIFDGSKGKGFPALWEEQHWVEVDNDEIGMSDLVGGDYCMGSAGIMKVEYLYSLECHEHCGGHEIRYVHEEYDGNLLKETERM